MRLSKLLAPSLAFTAAIAVATSALAAPATSTTTTVTVPAPTCIPTAALLLPSLGAAGDGRRVYLASNCAGCHGGNGAGGMGPNVQHASATLINTFITNGSPYGMVSYAHCLFQSDANNLAAYFATVGTPSEPTWSDWWNAAP